MCNFQLFANVRWVHTLSQTFINFFSEIRFVASKALHWNCGTTNGMKNTSTYSLFFSSCNTFDKFVSQERFQLSNTLNLNVSITQQKCQSLDNLRPHYHAPMVWLDWTKEGLHLGPLFVSKLPKDLVHLMIREIIQNSCFEACIEWHHMLFQFLTPKQSHLCLPVDQGYYHSVAFEMNKFWGGSQHQPLNPGPLRARVRQRRSIKCQQASNGFLWLQFLCLSNCPPELPTSQAHFQVVPDLSKGLKNGQLRIQDLCLWDTLSRIRYFVYHKRFL